MKNKTFIKLVKQTGLSQKKVAEELGISARMLRNYLTDTNPVPQHRVDKLQSIVDAINDDAYDAVIGNSTGGGIGSINGMVSELRCYRSLPRRYTQFEYAGAAVSGEKRGRYLVPSYSEVALSIEEVSDRFRDFLKLYPSSYASVMSFIPKPYRDRLMPHNHRKAVKDAIEAEKQNEKLIAKAHQAANSGEFENVKLTKSGEKVLIKGICIENASPEIVAILCEKVGISL